MILVALEIVYLSLIANAKKNIEHRDHCGYWLAVKAHVDKYGAN
jgi:hypothetical protein